MNKVSEYKIVESPNSYQLDDIVVNMIVDGWQPLGGVSATVEGQSGYYYHQAMVKYEDDA